MPSLNESDRQSVFRRVLETIDKKFLGAEPDTTTLADKHEQRVVQSATAEEFEQAMNLMLKDLGASHTGFFHESAPRAAGRIALAATFTKAETNDGTRWVFQDVHPGGAAAQAGIRPGDVLLTVGDKELIPPEATAFSLGQSYTFTVRRADGSTTQPTLVVPGSKEKQRPIVVPNQVVTATKLAHDIGLIRVSMFPGILGMDVARDISRAVKDLGSSRLIFDLRGNTGGGIGCLRVMSHLCPDRRGVGYSVGRKLATGGFDKERLPTFDRIPSSQLQVLPLMFRFALKGRSVAVFTESLGPQRHHGHVVMLVNEHSLPPVAEGTVTRDIATHQAIWQQAIEEGILTSNPWRSIDREGYESRDRVLSLDEEPRLKAAVSPKMARFVDFALGTGGRLEEVRTAHVDLAVGTVRFHGKFDKVRTVPMLTPESIAAAKVQIETEGKLWTMNPQHFRDVLARAAKRLGIPHLSPHTLRHTFATRFLQAGGDIYVLSKLLGHSSVSVTERHYAHVVDADIIARARQIRLPSPEGAAKGATQSATPARGRRAS